MADPVRGFYDALADDYHRIFEDWDAAVVRQGDVLARLLGRLGAHAGAAILDCTCGIGTQALGLAARGYRVHGTDLSGGAIARARREAARLGIAASFAVADVRELETAVPGSYDAVVALDNSLSHLETAEDLALAVRGMAVRTATGGIVLASVRDYDALAARRETSTHPRVRLEDGGRSVTFQLWTWDDDGEGYEAEMLLLAESPSGWHVSSSRTRLRALRRSDLVEAFTAAGLDDVAVHEPAGSDYYQPVVAGRR
jgi:glycine/sarcosine N-methyltransferase